MPSSQPVVFAQGLEKRFGETRALRGLDLALEQGQILGVLGPNGAGKTTAVRILTTLALPDAGTAQVAGFDVVQHPQEVRLRIGVTGQYAAVDELLTGRENLEMIGQLARLSKSDAATRATELLERLDLVDAADRVSKGYSGGMRRRLDLAASLMARPPIIFLDEPTTGLDPRSRMQMWELIEDLVHSGASILLTTQYLEEADRLADDIVIIDHGLAIARGTADELKEQAGGQRLEVVLTHPEHLERASTIVQGFGEGEVQLDPRRSRLMTPVSATDGLLAQVVLALDGEGIAVTDLGVRKPTLDDVFLQLTGRELSLEESTETDVVDVKELSTV
ncbi:MAG: ATP-binding cassette domain-containing protein [Thermomicrobiales bacterium]|nr:ATP-binding cassette domain-containing protein [Thermomicrobiales bacterium]